MLGMQRKLIVALLAALVAFFGAMSLAAAAPASVRPANAGPAAPGTYAARYGAPMCDDRAASSYAAEPTPPAVDGGELAVTPDGDVHVASPCSVTVSAEKGGTPVPTHHVRAVSIHAADVAVVPSPIAVPAAIGEPTRLDRPAIDGARDGHAQGDSPPPRPIPWRR